LSARAIMSDPSAPHARQLAQRRAESSYEFIEGWGMTSGAHSRVLRPGSVEDVARCLEQVRREGLRLGLRGTGNSYGDASVNGRGHVLDISRLDRVLSFDRESGVVEAQAGVTIQQLWRAILPHGWWPRVVSGTMFPTLAGAAAMNIHGKNNYAVGTIGDAIVAFDLVLPSGELRTCSRTQNSDLFHAAIGGLGMLGVFTRIVLHTKRVHSGDLEVKAISTRNLREMLEHIEAHRSVADYLVGWIDCFAGGDRAGRGLIHQARYLDEGEDLHPELTLRAEHQELPANILGVLPKSEVWRALRLFNNDAGMRAVNAFKWFAGHFEDHRGPFRQSHAAFAFLLDYVPNWKWAYGREPIATGLIQYQPFLPAAVAHDVALEILERCRRARLVPYLGVVKRHRPDPFWLTHALDGWSFALDFKVTPQTRAQLWKHCAELTELVLQVGGRFYFAKDLVLGARDLERFVPADRLAAFRALKRELDPDLLLATDLSRRVLGW
jgi:decaprenylphospho-beta-D-ribofuranose 2-oxidase